MESRYKISSHTNTTINLIHSVWLLLTTIIKENNKMRHRACQIYVATCCKGVVEWIVNIKDQTVVIRHFSEQDPWSHNMKSFSITTHPAFAGCRTMNSRRALDFHSAERSRFDGRCCSTPYYTSVKNLITTILCWVFIRKIWLIIQVNCGEVKPVTLTYWTDTNLMIWQWRMAISLNRAELVSGITSWHSSTLSYCGR